MKHWLILVEGQTEEVFVKELLAPYLLKYNVNVSARIIMTKRLSSGFKYKGGITSFKKLEIDINNCLSDSSVYVSMIIDFYGLPNDLSGKNECDALKSPAESIVCVENKLFERIANKRFLPYIQMHEFEALLFSSSKGFEYFHSQESTVMKKINKIINEYPNPEDINQGIETAPSKRLKSIIIGYDKINQGNLIALETSLEVILQKCHRFKAWVNNLIQFELSNK